MRVNPEYLKYSDLKKQSQLSAIFPLNKYALIIFETSHPLRLVFGSYVAGYFGIDAFSADIPGDRAETVFKRLPADKAWIDIPGGAYVCQAQQ
jgi:hypothetical protein